MAVQPTLSTTRLVLRPFTVEDAPVVQTLAGDFAVADTTLSVPHPYLDGMAEEWIAKHSPAWDEGSLAAFAITWPAGGLVGAVSLTLALPHRRGELGYWVGRPFWNRGLATEAGRAIIEFGFTTLDLNRIQAMHLTRNPASGRVLQKLGMQLEGIHRQMYWKHGRAEDVARHALLRDDWQGDSR